MMLTQSMAQSMDGNGHLLQRHSSSASTPLTSPPITPTLSPTTSIHSSPLSSHTHSLSSSPHSSPAPSPPISAHDLFNSCHTSRTTSLPTTPSPHLSQHLLSYPSSPHTAHSLSASAASTPLHGQPSSRSRNRQFPPRKPPPPGSVAIGSKVVMRSSEFIHPSLVKYAGSEASIVGLPSHPITWYTVKFHDGKEVKLRSSSFDIVGYEMKHSTAQQFKAAMAKQHAHMEQMRAMQQQQAMMAASHSALNSATSSSAASSVPSPVPHHLLQHSQAMAHASAHNGQSTQQQMHSVHHSPHPINTASMLPPMSAQAAQVAAMQHHQQQQQQQQHAVQQQQHKAQVQAQQVQAKPLLKKEVKAEMMNGAVQAVPAAAVPAHAMNGSSNPQLTLNIPHHHTNGASSASSAAACASQQQHSSQQQQQPKMAAPVNPLAMNPLFNALSSLQNSFNPSPAAAAAMPFLSPFALQSFFAQATPYDAAIMAAALRANGFPIPISTMTGLAAMQQMAVQAQAQAASQQQQQQQQQQQAAMAVPHLTIPHQPQLQHSSSSNGGGSNGSSHVSNHHNSNGHNSHSNHSNGNSSHHQQPTQATLASSHHNTVAAAPVPAYNSSVNNSTNGNSANKHSRPNSSASTNGRSISSNSHHTAASAHSNHTSAGHSSSAQQQPTVAVTPTAAHAATPLNSFSIHSALPSPLASPSSLHLNTADILPSPRLPMPDLFFSPPPTSTSLSQSLQLPHHFLSSSFLQPFSNPPSALTSPTAHAPIVPFDGVIGDISSPHGISMLPHYAAASQHTAAYAALHNSMKRGHDDLLSAPHSHSGGLGGMGLGLSMVGGGGGGEYEMLLPLFTPTNASFERLLADTEVKQDNSKRIRID